jgi:hypothetical protein
LAQMRRYALRDDRVRPVNPPYRELRTPVTFMFGRSAMA